jgi:hypothetical protein
MPITDDALNAALAKLNLKSFEVPKPKPNGFLHLFDVLQEKSLERLADLADEYALPGGIGFGFAEHRLFNAFAERSHKDIVCLTSSSVRVLWSLCNAVMEIRELFPWIDDIDRLGEAQAPPVKGELFYVPPKDHAEIMPIRRRLATALFNTAVDFLLMHEIAHLWNGHVDYLHQKAGPRPFTELQLTETSGLDPDFIRALEFDADSFAVQKIFARAYRENPFQEFSEGLSKDHRLPEDGDRSTTWFFTWFALYAAFRAFDEARAVETSETWVHPPAPLRQACLLSTVSAVCGKQGWSELSMDTWTKIAIDAGLECERAICQMRRITLNTSGFHAAWDGPAFTQIEKYIETWDQLAPDLKEIKRGPMTAQETEAASS